MHTQCYFYTVLKAPFVKPVNYKTTSSKYDTFTGGMELYKITTLLLSMHCLALMRSSVNSTCKTRLFAKKCCLLAISKLSLLVTLRYFFPIRGIGVIFRTCCRHFASILWMNWSTAPQQCMHEET